MLGSLRSQKIPSDRRTLRIQPFFQTRTNSWDQTIRIWRLQRLVVITRMHPFLSACLSWKLIQCSTTWMKKYWKDSALLMKSLKVVVSKQSQKSNKSRQPLNRLQPHQTKFLPSRRKRRQRERTLKEVKSKKSAQTMTQSSIQMQSSHSPPSRWQQMLKMQALLQTKNLRQSLEANSQHTSKKKLMTAKLQLNLT